VGVEEEEEEAEAETETQRSWRSERVCFGCLRREDVAEGKLTATVSGIARIVDMGERVNVKGLGLGVLLFNRGRGVVGSRECKSAAPSLSFPLQCLGHSTDTHKAM
jgi:hypothetical protein